MTRRPIDVGSVVISTAGRDRGRMFAVVEIIDQDFVRIANGDLRTLDRMKKKRRKHLRPTGEVIGELCSRMESRTPVRDSELRAWLREAGQRREEEELVQI